MTMRVVPVADGLIWDPNDPQAALLSLDNGPAVLGLKAHFDDPDQRTVVLRWDWAVACSMLGFNDEGRWAHRLYSVGLDRLLWLGVVEGTDWPTPPVAYKTVMRHYIAPLKECVVEVLAPDIVFERSDRPPTLAAADASTRRKGRPL
ncbi:MAG TPA: hypothetical protein VIQ76_19620 [Propionibacteriaceae bacterium]|jgi:hypothetical protein